MTPDALIPCAAHVPPRCRGKTKNVCESHAGLRAGITHCIRNPKPKSAHKLVKSIQILVDSSPTPTKIQPKSTPDGPRRPLRDHLGAMFEKDLILKAPKWPLELQNEPKLKQNQEKRNNKKTNTKNIAFPGMFFSRFLVILKPFLE